MANAFTNRPDLAGQPIEPGSPETWEYRQATRWVEPDISGLDSYAFINGNPIMANDWQIQPVQPQEDYDPSTAPSESIETLENNIPLDRNKFRESLIQQFEGEDPTRVNISKKTTNIVKTNLRGLWNYVFQGKIPWGGRLTEDQARFWNKEKQTYYANVYNQVLEQNKINRQTMKAALDRFDDEAKRIAGAQYKELPEEKRAKDFEYWKKKEKIGEKYKETPSEKEERIKRIEEFKSSHKSPTGTLTENQVSKNLFDLALASTQKDQTPSQIYAQLYDQYRGLIAAGMSREDAYNEILNQYGKKAASPSGQKKSFKHLWD